MNQNSLSKWLKVILVGVGLCGLVVYGVAIPSYGASLVADYPEFSGRFWPWLLFLLATGIPCYAALFLGWRIASSIGQDRTFTAGNARRLTLISRLAAGDAAFLFLGNVALLLLSMSHPGVFLGMLLVAFAGVAVAVAAACLSHLVQKAAALQEQSDLTI
ncbi:MAG: DUF2975 domain-containing protein [Clostridia bacterium]|nr:DUF2975 domain-containing protein [Clostridia bacterium]